MKKGLLFVLTFSLLFTSCLGLAACGESAQTEQYTVTFESNGGSAVEAVTVDKGGSVNLPDTSKTGYTFEGWFEREDFSGSKLSTPYTPSGNVTLYAKWKQGGGVTPDGMKYVITFVSNGGSNVENMTVASGAALSLPVPSREGYTFIAWCTDVQCENTFTQTLMPAYDFTLYAKWESIEFGVESAYLYAKGFTEFTDPAVDLLFPKFDGKKIKRKIVSDDVGVIGETKYDLNTDFTPKEDYQIKWYLSADFKELIGSQRSELHYADNFFFVTINDKNGRVMESLLVNIYVLQDFQYAFYDTSSRYHESYRTEPVQTVRVIEGNYLTPITIESGYAFSKWTDEAGAEFNFGVKPSKSAKLFARYESVACSVDLNGGAGAESVIYAPFEKVEFDGFYDRANWVFDGLTANGVHLTDEQGFALKDAKTVSFKAVRKLTAKWSEYTQEKYFSFKQVLDSRNNLIGYSVALSVSPASHKLYIPNEYRSLPVIDIAEYGFSGSKFSELRVPDSVTSIGRSAFSGCVGLMSVTIGDSVTSIGNSAFKGCSGITTVTIPDSVTSIGDSAFSDCIALTSATIGDSVASIGDSAFKGCIGLTSAAIPDSVTFIGGSAFAGCYGLTSMTLPFVGETKYSTRYAHLGYLFGASSFNYNSQYVPFALRTVIITGGNTIGEYAFYGCGRLTSVTIPNTVTTIYSAPFSGCYGLTSITLPFIGQTKDGTSKAYVGYLFGASSSDNNSQSVPSTLKTVIITGGDIIGSSAFSGCSGLTSVIMPDGVTTIGSSAFSGCSGLTSVTIPDGVTTIGNSAFGGCSGLTSVTIPDGVTTIGDSAFSDCSGLTSVTVPSRVTSIGDSAFNGCSGLTAVYYMGDMAGWCGISFDGYHANPLNFGHNLYIQNELITEAFIPSSISSINSYAFSGFSGLRSVTIPAGVTSIGYSAFNDCSGLTAVNYMGDMAGWCGISFGGYNANPLSFGHNLYIQNELVTEAVIPSSVSSINWGAFIGCTGLVSVTIPDSVTEIASSAFSGCTGLVSVTIPDSVTKIDGSVFKGCTGLTSVTIPDSVTSIGDSAFSGCSGLTSVTIPDSVSSINYSAFSGCSGLTSVTIPSSVTLIGSNVFENCSNLKDIRCEAASRSVDWESNWNYNCPATVHWGYNNITTNAEYNYVIKNNQIYLTKYKGSGGKVEVPAVIEGLKVVSINAVFAHNDAITSIIIPNSVTSISEYAFSFCTWLTSVVIPNSVTSIRARAFYGCSRLKSVTIPNGVTSIGSSAFAGCSILDNIWCEATSRPSGWFITWKDFCPATVHWGGTWEYVNGVPKPKAA